MSRRSFFATLSCVLLSLGILAIMLAGLLRYQRPWYKQAAMPPGPARHKYSEEFTTECIDMFANIDDGREWTAHFTDVQINSYIEEDFRQQGIESHLLPEGITEPRIVFDPERIHLAFRYGKGLFSTVITVDLHVWMVPQEQNVVALELEGFHAGALPISARSLLEQMSEVGRSNGIGVNWYRDPKTGHPVAVLRFQEDQQRAKWVLSALRLEAGAIIFGGRSPDAPPAPTKNINAAAAIGLQPLGN
jgi:hypothetical protein